ncbi:MAG: hypothetical protein VYA80_00170 [Pseudomonadota bacterium]|nr:hypothetical protein [Pseudomonadota bacterium]
MLKSIFITTIAVLNLEPVEIAYQEAFSYLTVEQGVIGKDVAEVWDAPHTEGRKFLLMKANSDKEVYLRFVQLPPVDGYSPMNNHGWNGTELLVLDPDKIAEELENSSFELIGAPKDLWPNGPRAMQVIGPGDEVLYLTRNQEFATSAEVDRVFIMVLGGPSMNAFADFYGNQLGLEVGDPIPFNISVVSKAQGRPPETRYPLAVATVSSDFLIELDEYPSDVNPKPMVNGEIPPGVSMVSFMVDSLNIDDLKYRAEPIRIDDFPYSGRRTAVTIGPAGEWLELIEHSDVR